jgi:glycosyltransferase involved in cell wall biosynthesis
MEYMACGKPVIASYNTGHKDILTEENSFMLTEMNEDKIYFNNKLWADWHEPSLDEIIAKLEYAYFNRNEIRQKGKTAGKFMKKFTWTQTARELISIIDSV